MKKEGFGRNYLSKKAGLIAGLSLATALSANTLMASPTKDYYSQKRQEDSKIEYIYIPFSEITKDDLYQLKPFIEKNPELFKLACAEEGDFGKKGVYTGIAVHMIALNVYSVDTPISLIKSIRKMSNRGSLKNSANSMMSDAEKEKLRAYNAMVSAKNSAKTSEERRKSLEERLSKAQAEGDAEKIRKLKDVIKWAKEYGGRISVSAKKAEEASGKVEYFTAESRKRGEIILEHIYANDSGGTKTKKVLGNTVGEFAKGGVIPTFLEFLEKLWGGTFFKRLRLSIASYTGMVEIRNKRANCMTKPAGPKCDIKKEDTLEYLSNAARENARIAVEEEEKVQDVMKKIGKLEEEVAR